MRMWYTSGVIPSPAKSGAGSGGNVGAGGGVVFGRSALGYGTDKADDRESDYGSVA